MADETTTYGTPAPETPFSTPISTPRRVPYRVNPVKMVRQHVPVIVQSCSETTSSTPSNTDSMNSRQSVNPMQTKRVKCTVRPNSEFHDGVGDRIESLTDDSKGLAPYNLSSQQSTSSDLHNKSSIYKASNRADVNSKLLNSLQAECLSICHSSGDAVPIKFEKKNVNSNSKSFDAKCVAENISNTAEPVSDVSDSQIEQTTTIMEKEIRLIDELVSESSSYCNDCNSMPVCPIQDNNVIDKSNIELQTVINVGNPRKVTLPKKSNHVSDSQNEIATIHKCDKKKFYDPKDIRKYMVKKRTERLAKEREEKNKKDNEMAALKRKTEITKTFMNRNRFPYYQHADMDKEIPVKKKFSKKPGKYMQPAAEESHSQLMHIKQTKPAYHYTTINKPAISGLKDRGIIAKRTSKLENKNMKIGNNDNSTVRELKLANVNDFKSIDDTEKYFKKKFNDIITKCVEEASKIVNAELRSPSADSSKTPNSDKLNQNSSLKRPQVVGNATSTELLTGLNVINILNPYFSNAVEGKPNSTDTVDVSIQNVRQKSSSTNVKKQKILVKDACRMGDLKKRPKLDRITPVLNEFLDNYGNLELTGLKSELTLSDLNYSGQKLNEICLEPGEENSDRTYIVCDSEARRKSARTTKNMESKENFNSSLEVSGVKPLSFKPFVSTPLMEKNLNNTERFSWFHRSATEPKPNTKVRISLDRMFLSEEKRDLKKSGFENQNKNFKNLMKVSSLESLTIQNTSTLLPKSSKLTDDEEYNVKVKSSAVILSQDPALIFANTTLPATDVERASECDENRENRNTFSMYPSEDQLQISSSNLLNDLCDQMLKNEDEKLLHILRKIHEQKEALNKYLRSEVFTLELQKSQYRENKEEEKVKTIKKKQRGILLKVTKNIIELDKMKKSVIETVEKRKTELLKQKAAIKERKIIPKQKMSNSKQKKKSDTSTKTILVSEQMNTLFGISSSTCTSVVLENDEVFEDNLEDINKYLDVNKELSKTLRQETIKGNSTVDKNVEVKDTATSPIHFNAGFSIRLDLDPEKLGQLKNSCAEIKIHSMKRVRDDASKSVEMLQSTVIMQENENNACVSEVVKSAETRDNKAVKIKRPLSPVILTPSKKFLQLRRLSSSSEMTLFSLNDTTTTDQSDVELRISALQEQLRQRKLEAERLRKEEKQLRKEKLKSKEQSLLKQLEAYDEYINRVSKMLAENNNFTEIAKPQIRPHPVGSRRQCNEKLYDRKADTYLPPIISDYVDDASKKHNDDLETNTEDSEKQMQKADSGILIESEITEPSENVDLKPKSGPAVIEKNENENLSSFGSEVETQCVSADDGGKRSTESEKKIATSNDLLQTINDLESEVHSLSEQLYSLDFDEEIPEDLPETKSDASEINGNNTLMSIEEILSDRHSDRSEGVQIFGIGEPKFKAIFQETVENLEKKIAIEEKTISEGSQINESEVNEPPIKKSDKHYIDAENIGTITSTESRVQTAKNKSIVREIQKIEINDTPLQKCILNTSTDIHQESRNIGTNETSLQNSALDIETEDSEIREEIHNIESLSDNIYEDTAISGRESAKVDAAAKNVAKDKSHKTIQEEDILLEGSVPSIKNETSTDSEFGLFNMKNVSEIENSGLDFREKQLSEGEISNKDSILEDIKSISSLAQISQNVESVSKLMAKSDGNDSKTSQDLIKIDYLNESEGTDVPEVDKEVLPFEEIRTMMDGMKFSSSDTSVIVSKSSIDIRQNYNNVLVNLKSYFDSKTKGNTVEEIVTLENIKELAKKPDFLVTPMKVVHFALDNLEETDVSESLEYDVVPVTISDETIPKHLITDLDDNAKLGQFNYKESIDPDFECETVDAVKDSHHEEMPREKDRSVEEIVEDHSIPNLLGKTFVLNEESISDGNVIEKKSDSATSTPEKQISENLEGNMADEDLEQINEDRTPFLQALKRETDNLNARRKDSLDKMAADLFATLIEDNSISKSRIINDYETEGIFSTEEIAEISKPEKVEKLNELDNSFRSPKRLIEFEEKWLEKRLDFSESRLREAEELRLQQLKIEQEIEELQAQQHIPPYIYLREIPSKPPPPYTPPSDHTAKIPSNETELREFIGSTIEYVCDAIEKGIDIDNINQLPEYAQGKKKNREVIMYKRFLFDLTKEIARNILEESKKSVNLPWEEVSRLKVPKRRPHKQELQKLIDNEIRVLFGFESKINKEKLTIQWSRKRRTDFVDDVLIQELQEEEHEWTNYEKDELIIKNQITENLLDALIDDTVISLQNAIRRKDAKGFTFEITPKKEHHLHLQF